MAYSWIESELRQLERHGLLRSLKPRNGLDYCSNDYLGLASDPLAWESFLDILHQWKPDLGSTGSRLLRGQSNCLDRVEGELADFTGSETALLFPSGYQANVGLMSTILSRDDLVLSDERNHASIVDGIRLSGARCVVYPHRQMDALDELLQREGSSGKRVIVTESVFSLDGTVAPLSRVLETAERLGVYVVVDESHATGLWGKRPFGSGHVEAEGLRQHPSLLASVHTGGKALGAAGAWIACTSLLKSYLVNRCRALIYSTAVSPLVAASLVAALKWGKDHGAERVDRVHTKAARFRSALGLPSSDVPIVPIILGETARSLRAADQLQAQGFDIRAIRPPSVPQGGARLRITLNSQSSDQDDGALIAAVRALDRVQ